MNSDLSDYRKSYEKGALLEGNLPDNPIDLFKEWFNEVDQTDGVDEANAMTIASIGSDGFPKSRVVLLKHFDTNGFVFYTNYNSEKGKAIQNNPNVCLSFFWPNLERQVIIKGIATKQSEKISTAYFHSRPRGSQLGAWASDQSTEIDSREILTQRLKELENQYKEKEIPKPPHWGGFVVAPQTIEFWQGRPNRLHDRMLYKTTNNNWNHKRLAP
ncbi:pyridoxamine 5'-phosphate oxidase [Aquimarina agarilytica]|uniref:pyridoxamine 5'-phosphate oxidase n=1 Tax=Aquimarina agarilytica TaxID=1087449 RepID=UPI000289F94B|nr:pyridoxamine 5'-phosphate oxidase [Aquimarina agarilytica]